MKIIIALWLVAAVAVWFVGCATGKDEKAETAVAGKPYAVHKLVLPEQKKGAPPFSVRKARYSRYDEKDLAPAMAVTDYLEAIATTGHLPLRVKEGFLNKQNGQWYLAEWPPEVAYRQFCAGYPTVVANAYYVVNMKTLR